MPIPGARFRWKTYPSGKNVRLAFKGGEVVEAKSKSGAVHTQAEFAADRKRRKRRRGKKGAIAGMLGTRFKRAV